MSHNNMGRQEADSVESLMGLLECPSIHTLNVNNNYLDDPMILPEVFGKMDKLNVLFCKENEFQKKITNFRRKMIGAIPNLADLNDRPVFDKERRCVEAWVRGAKEAEDAEKQKIKEEEEKERKDNYIAFNKLVNQTVEDDNVKKEEKKKIEKLSLQEMLKEARKKQIAAIEKNDQSIEYVREETESKKIFHAKTRADVELAEAKELENKAKAELVKKYQKEQEEELQRMVELKRKKEEEEIKRREAFFTKLMSEQGNASAKMVAHLEEQREEEEELVAAAAQAPTVKDEPEVRAMFDAFFQGKQ